MDAEKLKALVEAAKQASPGEREIVCGNGYTLWIGDDVPFCDFTPHVLRGSEQAEKDAKFTTLANPQTVLELAEAFAGDHALLMETAELLRKNIPLFEENAKLIVTMAARISQLESALAPFAAFARCIDGNTSSSSIGDTCPFGLYLDRLTGEVTLGHCRAAARVLEKI